MDDTARLRRTVRRSTAVLVAAIGITGIVLLRGDPGLEVLLIPFVVGSILYFPVEFVLLTPGHEDGDDASPGSGGTSTADEGD